MTYKGYKLVQTVGGRWEVYTYGGERLLQLNCWSKAAAKRAIDRLTNQA